MEKFENWLIVLTIMCFFHMIITMIHFVIHRPKKESTKKNQANILKNMFSDVNEEKPVDVTKMKNHEFIIMLKNSEIEEIKHAREVFIHSNMEQRVKLCDVILAQKIKSKQS